MDQENTWSAFSGGVGVGGGEGPHFSASRCHCLSAAPPLGLRLRKRCSGLSSDSIKAPDNISGESETYFIF